MIDNPYWDAVKDHVTPSSSPWGGGPEVGNMLGHTGDFERWMRETPQRHDLVKQYAWTITNPATVDFVAEHSGGRLVDPMAGTGYWGWILAQAGVDVASYDIDPGGNHWHAGHDLYGTVTRLPGTDAAALHADRALLLAWPPYDSSDGADVLAAYRGGRVIYIGEGDGGCTGDDNLHRVLADWTEVASHAPIRWFGMHDDVTVYDRRWQRNGLHPTIRSHKVQRCTTLRPAHGPH